MPIQSAVYIGLALKTAGCPWLFKGFYQVWIILAHYSELQDSANSFTPLHDLTSVISKEPACGNTPKSL